MRGHHQLIAMRLKGVVPTYGVEVETDHTCSDWPEQWAQLHVRHGIHSPKAYVHIDPHDRLERLDLRWVVGLEVRVEGTVATRVEAVMDALSRAGATRAIGIVFMPRPGGETEAIEIIDSKGVASWCK